MQGLVENASSEKKRVHPTKTSLSHRHLTRFAIERSALLASRPDLPHGVRGPEPPPSPPKHPPPVKGKLARRGGLPASVGVSVAVGVTPADHKFPVDAKERPIEEEEEAAAAGCSKSGDEENSACVLEVP